MTTPEGLLAEVSSLSAANATLRKALEPFRRVVPDAQSNDDMWSITVTAGDLRALAAAAGDGR